MEEESNGLESPKGPAAGNKESRYSGSFSNCDGDQTLMGEKNPGTKKKNIINLNHTTPGYENLLVRGGTERRSPHQSVKELPRKGGEEDLATCMCMVPCRFPYGGGKFHLNVG